MNNFINTSWLNINMLAINSTIPGDGGDGDTVTSELTKGERIGFGIVGILVLLLAAWLLWMFFKTKATKDQLRASVQDHSAWSFKGYWGRYRSGTIVILASTCFLVGFLLLLAAGTGTFNIANWRLHPEMDPNDPTMSMVSSIFTPISFQSITIPSFLL